MCCLHLILNTLTVFTISINSYILAIKIYPIWNWGILQPITIVKKSAQLCCTMLFRHRDPFYDGIKSTEGTFEFA